MEAASPLGWHRWAGDEGAVIGLERFGASAPGEEVLQHLGFTPEHVTSAALRVLGRTAEADREYTADATWSTLKPRATPLRSWFRTAIGKGHR